VRERSEIEDFIRHTPFTSLWFGGQAGPFASTLCIKRPEFSHEAEVRLLVQNLVPTDPGDFLNVKFDYAKVLDGDVALDPRLDGVQVAAIKKELPDVECTLKITQSDLYKIDEMRSIWSDSLLLYPTLAARPLSRGLRFFQQCRVAPSDKAPPQPYSATVTAFNPFSGGL
jgi:hypothetical protein